MADTDNQIPELLVAADHLEWWADGLPKWSDDGREPWYEFLDRRYRAEIALIERLRRAPNCRLKTCPRRSHVEITLAGVSISTGRGLAAACQEWARAARARVGC